MKKRYSVTIMVLVLFVLNSAIAFAAIDPYSPIATSANTELNSDSGKFSDGNGPRIEDNENKNIGYIVAGNYAKYGEVQFGDAGASKVKIEVATPSESGTIEVYTGAPTGTPIATIEYKSTGDWQAYQWFEAPVSGVTGTQDLFVVFVSGDLNVRNVQFEAADGAAAPAAEANPKTGDSGVMLYVALAAGAAMLMVVSRKKFAKQS
ncbi:carbohydrate-binding protein [Paenibacillus sp. 2TAB19]|uniref:carbohydrate-binding protein n=1 Tax=Paenibacillus sp. 2TAB19 TaxID=3233003 RepID=UPI003F9744EF